MTSFTFEEKRARSVSIAEGGIIDDNSSQCSKVDDIEYFVKGVRGKYSGEIIRTIKLQSSVPKNRESDNGHEIMTHIVGVHVFNR